MTTAVYSGLDTSDVEPVTLKGQPREPLSEGVLNICAILEEYLAIGTRVKEFGTPFITRVNPGRLMSAPETWPCVDVRFSKAAAVDMRTFGSMEPGPGGKVRFPALYYIRYFHAQQGQKPDDLEVTRNLGKISDLFRYRNDLHGFCPRSRAEVTGISQDLDIFAEFDIKDFIVGGQIELRVPIIAHRTFYDGNQTDRDAKYPSGPRH